MAHVGDIEYGEKTTVVPQKKTPREGRRIGGSSCDATCIVDGQRNGKNETGNIEHGKSPVAFPPETTLITVGVEKVPRDLSSRVDALSKCAEGTYDGTGRVKIGHIAFLIP